MRAEAGAVSYFWDSSVNDGRVGRSSSPGAGAHYGRSRRRALSVAVQRHQDLEEARLASCAGGGPSVTRGVSFPGQARPSFGIGSIAIFPTAPPSSAYYHPLRR